MRQSVPGQPKCMGMCLQLSIGRLLTGPLWFADPRTQTRKQQSTGMPCCGTGASSVGFDVSLSCAVTFTGRVPPAEDVCLCRAHVLYVVSQPEAPRKYSHRAAALCPLCNARHGWGLAQHFGSAVCGPRVLEPGLGVCPVLHCVAPLSAALGWPGSWHRCTVNALAMGSASSMRPCGCWYQR